MRSLRYAVTAHGPRWCDRCKRGLTGLTANRAPGTAWKRDWQFTSDTSLSRHLSATNLFKIKTNILYANCLFSVTLRQKITCRLCSVLQTTEEPVSCGRRQRRARRAGQGPGFSARSSAGLRPGDGARGAVAVRCCGERLCPGPAAFLPGSPCRGLWFQLVLRLEIVVSVRERLTSARRAQGLGEAEWTGGDFE